MARTTVFETETCGRCGGTGHYSYNQIDGTVCFGCHGSKVRKSKRGQAAYVYFEKGLYRPLSDVKVGEFIFQDGKWRTVTAVKESGCRAKVGDGEWINLVDLDCGPKRGLSAVPSTMIKSVESDAKLKELREAALAYQATLTKEGKVRK